MPAQAADTVLWTFIAATTFPIWLPVVLEIVSAIFNKIARA